MSSLKLGRAGGGKEHGQPCHVEGGLGDLEEEQLEHLEEGVGHSDDVGTKRCEGESEEGLQCLYPKGREADKNQRPEYLENGDEEIDRGRRRSDVGVGGVHFENQHGSACLRDLSDETREFGNQQRDQRLVNCRGGILTLEGSSPPVERVGGCDTMSWPSTEDPCCQATSERCLQNGFGEVRGTEGLWHHHVNKALRRDSDESWPELVGEHLL